MDADKFEFHLTPLNEFHELGYHEKITCTITDIHMRCNQILATLSTLFPKGTFDIKLEHNNQTWYYRNRGIVEGGYYDKNSPNNFYDENCDPIVIKLTNYLKHESK